MTTPDEHRRNAIEKAAQALFANDGLWEVSLDAHKAPHRARAERAIDAALPDLRRAFAEEAAQAIEALDGPNVCAWTRGEAAAEVRAIGDDDQTTAQPAQDDAAGPTAGGEGDGTGETAETAVEAGFADAYRTFRQIAEATETAMAKLGATLRESLGIEPTAEDYVPDDPAPVVRVQIGVDPEELTRLREAEAERDDLRRKLAAVRALVAGDPIDARRAYAEIRRALDGEGQ